MPVRARFRPHPKGFGFVTPVGPDGVTPREAVAADASGATRSGDSAFVPPDLARGRIADDLLDVELVADEQGLQVTSATVVDRPRRMLVGTVQQGPGAMVVEPDPQLGSGWVSLQPQVAAQLQRAAGRQVVVLLAQDEDGAPVGRALVTGPHVVGSPKAVRANATVVAFGRNAPSLVPGGPAAAGLDVGEATATATRIVGHLAGGGRGTAAGLDRMGPVPGAELDRVDRTDEVTVTVDDVATRDVDDALHATWTGDDAAPVRVAVHIADVAGAVGLDSPADHYARVMASTAYFAVGGNAPMLDPELAEDALSLLPGEERGSLSVRFSVAVDGTIDDVVVEVAVMRSDAKLSYAALERWLDGDADDLRSEMAGTVPAMEVMSVLGALQEASRRLGVERDGRDTLEDLFTSAEVEPALVDGKLRTRDAEPHARAYRVVERLMVAANEAVASWLVAHDVPALYRAHTGLDPDRVPRLVAACQQAGVAVPALGLEATEQPDGSTAVTRVDGAEQDLDAALSQVVAAIDRLSAEGREQARDLLVAVVTGSVARATYEPDPSAHTGLGSGAYVHFTSPIRRYADLVVHRQLRAALAGEEPPHTAEQLGPLSGWLDARAGAASYAAVRERNDLWAILLDRGFLDGDEPAVVTGLTPNGIRIRVPRIGIGGFVTAERALDLPRGERGRLEVDEHGLTTTSGPWSVGARVTVRATGTDFSGRVNWRLGGAPGR